MNSKEFVNLYNNENTVEIYRKALENLGGDEILKMSESEIIQRITALSDKDSTRYIYRVVACRFREENGLPYKNIARRFKSPTIKWSEKTPEKKEIEMLFSYLYNKSMRTKQQWKALGLISFLLITGCRISEAAAIKISNVALDKDKVVVTIKRLKKRNSEKDKLVIRRSYQISDLSLGEAFYRYVKWRLRLTNPPNEYLFLHASRKSLWYVIKRTCRLADIRPLSPHQFRHFVASYLARNKGILRAQQVLGHASPSITMNYVNKDEHIEF